MNTTSLSSTAQAILAKATEHSDRLVDFPTRLPVAARRAVARSMLKAGFVGEVSANADQAAWRTTETGERLALRATPAGLAAIDLPPAAVEQGGADPATQPQEPATQTDSTSAVPATVCGRVRLREAAVAILAAWDDIADGQPGLPGAVDTLRAALGSIRSRPSTGTRRPPRAGTKQQAVLALLRRPKGATVAQVAEATGWASHTVRGFFAGLNKKGVTVDVLERVRQVGSAKQGAKGSYTVYHVVEVG